MVLLCAALFGASALLTLALAPLAMRLARRWGVLDRPDDRKLHAEPVPLAGGWAIFVAFSVVVWGCLLGARMFGGDATWLPERARDLAGQSGDLILKFLPVWLGAFAIFVVGVVDDVRGLSARSRLLAQAAVGAGLAACGLHPDLSFLPAPLPAILGILWMVGITNAFNLIDGLDGLAAGVALVGAGALMTIMGIAHQPDWAFFLAVTCGALLGFLRWNWHPAKTFLGSGGSLLIGYLLAVSTMMVTYRAHADNWLVPLLTPIFIVAIPLYDTGSVILIRLLERRGILVADRSHFHHRLLNSGFSHKQASTFVILIAFAISLSAVRLVTATLADSVLILLQILGIFALLVLAERVANKIRIHARETSKERESRAPEEAGKP